MFRTRGHFERTEGVAGLAHAASIAAAIANGDAWGEEIIELLEVYERCDAPAGLAAFDAFRRPSSLTGPAHALGVVDDGAPARGRARDRGVGRRRGRARREGRRTIRRR